MWQVSTHFATSIFIDGHQYRIFKSLYILVQPGCTDSLDLCDSVRIKSLKSPVNGTQIRPLYNFNPRESSINSSFLLKITSFLRFSSFNVSIWAAFSWSTKFDLISSPMNK